MPKVIHILRKFEPAEWGGTESHIVGLVPALERFGWLSEVHAPREAGTDGGPVSELGATFRTFGAHYPALGRSAAERARLVASGGNLVTLDEPLRLLADRRASILHVHTQRRLGGVVRTAARIKRIPYAVSIHGPLRAGGDTSTLEGGAASVRGRHRGIDLGGPFGWLVGARRVVQDADLVFVLNAREEEEWRDDRRGRHLERIPHGVIAARATAEERAQVRCSIAGLGDAPFACVLGRLDPVKGQDLALAAFEHAAPANLHLVLAGAPTHADFARALSDRAARSPGRVHVTGGITPRAARALLAEATLVLVPSRAEAFGLVLVEAWAEGVPVLFSDVGGLVDLARDNDIRTGRVTHDDVDAWTEALRGAIAAPAALADEARRGPARVAAHYAWPAVAQRIAAAYERALAASRT